MKAETRFQNGSMNIVSKVFSATGTFMIRQGNLKLIAYAPLMPGSAAWPPQLFDLQADPWERNNIAERLHGRESIFVHRITALVFTTCQNPEDLGNILG